MDSKEGSSLVFKHLYQLRAESVKNVEMYANFMATVGKRRGCSSNMVSRLSLKSRVEVPRRDPLNLGGNGTSGSVWTKIDSGVFFRSDLMLGMVS